MRATELTEQSLKALSEVEADEPVVVSLFLNLDPSLVATGQARSSQITSVLARLDELLRESGLSEDALEALEVDRARIEDYLREDALDVDGVAGLAVYSASALDEYRAIKLLEPIETAVHVDQRPILEPIMGATDEDDWCVLLATRDSARIFRGGTTNLREIGDVQSKVKNQHAAGGWSQARFERSVEQDVERHLERATELLLSSFKRRPFEHLVVGANNESLRPALEGEAHSYLLERLRGWIDIDADLASEDEVLEAVRPVMDEQAEREETELLEVFAAAKATGGRAAEGLDLVLAALVERRVETLLIREGAEAPGTKCVTCSWLGGSGINQCPVDETALDAVDNIVEPAIQAAIQQAAAVLVVAADRESVPFAEPVAAVLRY